MQNLAIQKTHNDQFNPTQDNVDMLVKHVNVMCASPIVGPL